MLARILKNLLPTVFLSSALWSCAPGDVPLDDESATDDVGELGECPRTLPTEHGDAFTVLDMGVRRRHEPFVLEGTSALVASPAPRSCFVGWTHILWRAARTGMGATVFEPMFAAGLDPNLTDMDVDPLCAQRTGVRLGMTTLHHATREIHFKSEDVDRVATHAERVAMVRKLLEEGVDPNAVCAGNLYSGGNELGSAPIGGATPLMFTAAWDDHGAAMDATELLLAAGADVSVRARSVLRRHDSLDTIEAGDTALSIARRSGNGSLVERLIAEGAVDWDIEAEARAAKSSSADEVAEILRTKTVDPDRIWTLWFDDHRRGTAIAPLLEGGLDPNARPWGGKYRPMSATVFQAGVYATLPPADLRAIVEAGADVDEAGVVGLPPLVLVIDRYEDHRYMQVISMLLDAGANVEGRSADGDTPLLRAMYARRGLNVMNALLALGADSNAANTVGQRPLSVAIRAPKSLEMIDGLLLHGADLNADVQGVPLWAYALEHNPLYVSEDYVPRVAPILDRYVNHPSLVIDLSSPGVQNSLTRADSNPLVKPFADIIRQRAESEL